MYTPIGLFDAYFVEFGQVLLVSCLDIIIAIASYKH